MAKNYRKRKRQMSSKAYLLIKADRGKVGEVVSSLMRLRGVEAADPVTNKYDVIAVVRDDDLTNLSSLLTGEIKKIPHISRVDSCFRVASPL
jgi:DNA-binding Lrp family transcriptional regulator